MLLVLLKGSFGRFWCFKEEVLSMLKVFVRLECVRLLRFILRGLSCDPAVCITAC